MSFKCLRVSNRKQRCSRDSAQVDAPIRTRCKKLQNIRQGTSDMGSQGSLQREDNPLGPCGKCWSEVSAVTHFTAPSLPESAPTPLRLRHDSGAAWERAAHAQCAESGEKVGAQVCQVLDYSENLLGQSDTSYWGSCVRDALLWWWFTIMQLFREWRGDIWRTE